METTGVLDDVLRATHDVVKDVFGTNHEVLPFGSRDYGCAVPSSDMDMWVKIQPDLHENFSVLAARLTARLKASGMTKIMFQDKNHTLKWHDPRPGQDASLLLFRGDGEPPAAITTRFLKGFLQTNTALHRVVQRTIEVLRRTDVMNAHGTGQSVGDKFKTAIITVWCVGLFLAGYNCASDFETLLSLLRFSTDELVMRIDTQNIYNPNVEPHAGIGKVNLTMTR